MDIDSNNQNILFSAIVMDTCDISYTVSITDLTVDQIEEVIAQHTAMLAKFSAMPKTQLSEGKLKRIAKLMQAQDKEDTTNVSKLGELDTSQEIPIDKAMPNLVCPSCKKMGGMFILSGVSKYPPFKPYSGHKCDYCKHVTYNK